MHATFLLHFKERPHTERQSSISLCNTMAHRTPQHQPTISAEIDSATSSTVHGGRRRHVLLFPLPYQGHTNPMFRLAGVLHSRGLAVTVFHTSFNSPDPARHPHYRFEPVSDGTSGPGPDGVKDVVAHIVALGGACQAAFRDRLAAVLEEYSRDAVACLVADAHLLPMVEVATLLGLPALALRTGSAACFAGFLAYPMFCEKGYVPVKNDAQLDMPLSELPPYRVWDLMSFREDGHAQMRELLARAVTAVNASTGLILNTFDAIERRELAGLRRDLAVPVFDIGPLHKFSPAGAGIRRQLTAAWPEYVDSSQLRGRQ